MSLYYCYRSEDWMKNGSRKGDDEFCQEEDAKEMDTMLKKVK